MNLVTLTTDFGLSDSYVAQLKGAVFSVSPEIALVDISHQIPCYDILRGAFVLAEACSAYPRGSVHVAVVDPGVGSARKRLIIETDIGTGDSKAPTYFVGPDNGLLTLAAKKERIKRVFTITNLDKIPSIGASKTFEGRDIFAPTAAMLALGAKPEIFGIEINASEIQALPIPAVQISNRSVIGHILNIDQFGNASTNIKNTDLKTPIKNAILRTKNAVFELLIVNIYEEIPPNKVAILLNSQNHYELAANKQSAKQLLDFSVGDQVEIN